MKGWNKIETRTWEEMQADPLSWSKGYFPANYPYTEKSSLWKRNYSELKLRDLSILPFGEIFNRSILDIGCGGGMYMQAFIRLGAYRVCGQDIIPEYVESAKQFCHSYENWHSEIEIKAGDCTTILFPDSYFNFVFSGDVFEHITDEQKEKCIAEIYRVLAPGGLVTIKTPNLSYLKLAVVWRRIIACMLLINPFKIHIAHTRNNPDNEHHGLTTHSRLRKMFIEATFHEPVITYTPIERKGFPKWLAGLLKRNRFFNEHIIMTARKPVF